MAVTLKAALVPVRLFRLSGPYTTTGGESVMVRVAGALVTEFAALVTTTV